MLALRRPWPGMLRTLFRDPDRFKETYSKWDEKTYFVGDAARKDEDGYFWVIGRVDDTVNVSGTCSRPPRSSRRSSPTRRWRRPP